MRFITDDDSVFGSKEEADAHQEKLDRIRGFDGTIEKFLAEQNPEKADRSKQMYRRVVKEWLVWSLDKE